MQDQNLYKITIGDKRQYIILTQDQKDKFLNHLKVTEWYFVKKNIKLTEDVMKNVIVEIGQDKPMYDFLITQGQLENFIQSIDLYQQVMQSIEIKYIDLKDLAKKMTNENQFINSDTFSGVVEYLNMVIYRSTVLDVFDTSVPQIIIDEAKSKIFNPNINMPIDMYDIDFTGKRPKRIEQIDIGYKCKKIQRANNFGIIRLLKMMITLKWKTAIKKILPLFMKSIFHAKSVQGIIMAFDVDDWAELSKDIDWNMFMKIYSVYEKYEINYQCNTFKLTGSALELDFVLKSGLVNQITSPNHLVDLSGHTTIGIPDITPPYQLRTSEQAMDKFYELTDNKLIHVLNKIDRSGVYNSMCKIYFCGSLIHRCLMPDSQKYDASYFGSDIDIVVYPKGGVQLNEIANSIQKDIPGEVKIERVKSGKFSHKYWLTTEDDVKIEVFTSRKSILGIISRFHSDIVKSFFNGTKFYMFASALVTYLTRTNNNFIVYYGEEQKNRLIDILIKFLERGFKFRIPTEKVDDILSMCSGKVDVKVYAD